MSTDIRLQPYVAPTPSEIVEFDTEDPNLPGTVFTPNVQQASNTLYVSTDPDTISQSWIWNTTTNLYETYTVIIPNNTPFQLYGTTIDAGGNKTAFIQRTGPILINSTSTSYNPLYVYNRDSSGVANGPVFRRDSRVTSGYGLLVQNYKFSSTGPATVTQLRVNHDGSLLINDAYTLPNVDGTAGQYLQTSGAGVVSWNTITIGGKIGIVNSSGVYTYYNTLTDAMTAAVSGQTVELLTNITETGSVTITTKAGVKINGNGYTYTLSVDDATNAITQGAYIEMSNIRILRTGRANNATGRAFLGNLSTAPALRCQNVIFENTYGIGMQHKGDIHGLTIISFGVCLDSAFESAGAFNCNFTSSNSIGINLPNSSSSIINCNVNGLTGGIISGGTVYNSIGRTTSGNGIQATRVVNSTGVSSSGIGVSTNNGNNCVGISTSGVGLSGTFTNSTGISTSGFAGSGGTKTNCTLISSSNYGSNLENLNNCFLQSTTNVPLWLNSSKLINSCTVLCLWDNVGGHAINTTSASTGVDIRNCNLTVTNASAYCINGASASTFKYAANTCKGSTTAINTTNITQGITNTSDNQGNILI